MWSLVAVPIVTLLIQEMSNTIVSAINRGTFKVADWTIMPRKGVLQHFLSTHPSLAHLVERHHARQRLKRGFDVQDPDDVSPAGDFTTPNYDPEFLSSRHHHTREKDTPSFSFPFSAPDSGPHTTTATSFPFPSQEATHFNPCPDEDPEDNPHPPSPEHEHEHDLARQLSLTIKSVAHDLRLEKPKRYTYDEWTHFTKLVRFSRPRRTLDDDDERENDGDEDEEHELIEWDWIGENSPMLADITEAEWVLDRLCESLNRYTRRQAAKVCS